MPSTRAVLLALVVLLLATGAEGRRTERTRLFPTSLALSGSGISTAGDGTPHILYPSPDDWLRHAWREDGKWRDEAVEDEISTCAPQSIAVDGLGRPHITYTTGYLMYGVRTESGWELTQVASTISDAAIAFRPGDRPALLHDAPDLNLELLYLENGIWTAQDTGLTGFVDHRPALAFDANGIGHLLFYRDLTLFHATDASGTWTESALSGAPYLRAALSLDPQGHPHVAVANASTGPHGGLYHHWDDGSGWQSEDVVPPGDPFPSRTVGGLHFDQAGHPFLGYTDAQYFGSRLNTSPRIAYHDGIGWRQGYSRIEPEAIVQSSALAPSGELHLACAGSRLLHLSFSLPNLGAEWVALDVGPSGAGLRADGTLRVRNLGAGRSRPTRVAFYLSDDDLFDEGDEPVGRTRRLDTIGPGRERSFPVTIALPADAAGRRLLAVVDPNARRDDVDRPNNTAAAVVGE